MATNYETLLVTKESGITTIAFNRPEKRNAMSPQLHREMFDLLTDLRYDEETRVIVLTGAGESFCAGQDLKQYSLDMDSQPARVRDELREKVRRWRGEMLRTLPKPVIARITGWCLGGALTVIAGCDIAIASEEALFGLPEVNFGHFPAGETTAVSDRKSSAQTRTLLCVDRKDDVGARGGADRPHIKGRAARGSGQRSWRVGQVSRREESDGAEGGERSMVLQLVCVAGCRLRDCRI